MKKAKLDKEQWMAAYNQLERHGFITNVFDPCIIELIAFSVPQPPISHPLELSTLYYLASYLLNP